MKGGDVLLEPALSGDDVELELLPVVLERPVRDVRDGLVVDGAEVSLEQRKILHIRQVAATDGRLLELWRACGTGRRYRRDNEPEA